MRVLKIPSSLKMSFSSFHMRRLARCSMWPPCYEQYQGVILWSSLEGVM